MVRPLSTISTQVAVLSWRYDVEMAPQTVTGLTLRRNRASEMKDLAPCNDRIRFLSNYQPIKLFYSDRSHCAIFLCQYVSKAMRIDGHAQSVASLKLPYLLQLLEEVSEMRDIFKQEVTSSLGTFKYHMTFFEQF